MTIKTGSIGIPLRVATGFDMSGFTSLTLHLTKPDGTALTKTSGAGEVSAPAVELVNYPVQGADGQTVNVTVPPSTYFEYTNTTDEYDQTGTWTVCGIYADGSQTLPAPDVNFTVLAGCA